MVSSKQVLPHTRRRGTAVMVPVVESSMHVSSVTAVHLYVHMLQFSPFILSEDEVKAAPSNIKLADTKPKAGEL